MSRQILVLARRDPQEAMRVSAGLTIFGHQVVLIFMDKVFNEEDCESEQMELLELAEIEPLTMDSEQQERFTLINSQALGNWISSSEAVLNI